MTRVRLRTVFLFLAAGCHHDAPAAISDPKPAPIASASSSASASTLASAASPRPAVPADIDAGPLHEDTSQFGSAKLEPLRVELLPADQRKRDDKKPGFVRIALAPTNGLATFGLATCDDSSGGHCTNQGYARAAPHPLTRVSAPATSWAEYRARFAPDPKPSLLVLEDSARAPVAVRFLDSTLDVAEVALFADAPAFFVRTLDTRSGIDDPIHLHVVAFVGGELREVLSVFVGFRDADPCDDGKHIRTLGPPGSVTVKTPGDHPALHVREAASDCDAPFKVTQGCSGTERDYTWDASSMRFVPQGAGAKVTLRASPKGC